MSPKEFEPSIPAKQLRRPTPYTMYLLNPYLEFGPLDFVFLYFVLRLRVLIGNAAVK
jgi:hypothetical protein